MTQQTGTEDTAAKIKDLEEENELLLHQLHQVQEELEVYFLKYKDLEAGRGGSTQVAAGASIAWVDDELPEALAEAERLKALAQVQAEIKEIESRNSVNVKLGNMLLEGSSSVGGISKIPFALLAFWRNATSKHIPAALGGKEFTGVIKAYEERGFVGVKSILKDDGLSPIIKANAYTAVARHLMRRDGKAAAEAASKAFEIDPKPYRLKWLACRVHEAGNAERAEALLALLPKGITFSDSEAKQVSQIRYEAKNQRQRDARQKTQVVSKQKQVQKQLSELKVQVEALAKEKATLTQERSALQQEKVSLATARDEQAKVAGDRLNQINTLTVEKGQIIQARDDAAKNAHELKSQVELLIKEKSESVQKLEEAHQQHKVATEENELLLLQLHQVQEELENVYLEKQNVVTSLKGLEVQLEEAKRDHSSLTEKIQSLELKSKDIDSAIKSEKFVRGLLEQEQVKNVALAIARDEASRRLTELKAQLEALNKEKAALSQERSALQQEKASLATARDEQAKIAGDRLNQINALTAEKGQIAQARDEASKLLTELKAQLEGLNKEKAALSQERSALQQEKASLATARDEQAKVAGDRLNQINALTAEKGQIAQARDEAAKQLTELKGQVEVLAKEKAALSQERSVLQQDKASIATARDEQAKLAADRLNQINTLNTEKSQLQKKCEHLAKFESQNRDLMFRQSALEQELRKAEAQIELIKDLMIDDQRA